MCVLSHSARQQKLFTPHRNPSNVRKLVGAAFAARKLNARALKIHKKSPSTEDARRYKLRLVRARKRKKKKKEKGDEQKELARAHGALCFWAAREATVAGFTREAHPGWRTPSHAPPSAGESSCLHRQRRNFIPLIARAATRCAPLQSFS